MNDIAPSIPTRLMNVDEPIPRELFIFIDRLAAATAHDIRLTGSLASAGVATAALSPEGLRRYLAGELDFTPFTPRDLGDLALSPFFIRTIANYSTEYDAEYWRKQINPLYPSRLSALYAFGDYDTCLEVNRRYHWPLDQVRRFALKPLPITRVVKVNMEVISLMRWARKCGRPPEAADAWRHYWRGGGPLSADLPGPGLELKALECDIVWEYLIEGVLEALADGQSADTPS